ncbi:unnamed protein product, partial [Brassica oleracea]
MMRKIFVQITVACLLLAMIAMVSAQDHDDHDHHEGDGHDATTTHLVLPPINQTPPSLLPQICLPAWLQPPWPWSLVSS